MWIYAMVKSVITFIRSSSLTQQDLLCHQEPIRTLDLHTLYAESTHCVDIFHLSSKKKEVCCFIWLMLPYSGKRIISTRLLKILLIIPRHPFRHALIAVYCVDNVFQGA